MTDLFIRPSAKGAAIRDPVSGDILPDEGRAVPATPYWHGLLLRGDVVKADPAEADPATETELPPSAAPAPKLKTAKGE